MRKRTVFLILILVLFSGYAVHGHIVTSFFKWSLKEYCQRCLRADLSYDELYERDGKWVLENPRLISDAQLELGGYRMVAKQASIATAFSWDAGLSLALTVALNEPQIDVGEEARALKKLSKEPGTKLRFFDVRTNFAIADGKAIFHASDPGASPSEAIFFTIDYCCDKTKEGVAKIHFGEDTSSKGALEFSILDNEMDATQFQFLFKEVACAPLWMIIKSICPGCTGFDLSQGVLKGNMMVTVPSQGDPYFEGNASVRNLAIAHPVFEMDCQIPELVMELSPKRREDDTVATAGFIDLSRSTTIAFTKQKEVYWAVEAFGGRCSFESLNQIKIEGEALCRHFGDSRLLRIGGEMRGLADGQYGLKLDCRLHEEEVQNDTVIGLAAQGSNQEWKNLQFDCVHLTKSDFDFLQNIAQRVYPQVLNVDLFDGTIDIAMKVALRHSKFAEIEVHRFAVRHLNFSMDPKSWVCSLGNANGTLSIDCACEDPLRALTADLTVSDGIFSMTPYAVEVENSLVADPCRLSDLQAHFTLRRGVVQQSFVEGFCAGLKSRLELDGESTEEIATLICEGDLKTFSEVLPKALAQGIKKTLVEDTLKIVAQVKRASANQSKALFVGGTASLMNKGYADNEVAFGFNLPATLGEVLNNADQNGCWWSFFRSKVTNGWFDANQVPLEKFVSPFIFQQDQIRLSGVGDFHGSFDKRGLLLQYDAQDMVLKNADFAIEIGSLSQPDSIANIERLPAKYFVDFEDMSGKGTVPIHHGTYFEKNSGLLFTDVNAVFNHEEGLGVMSQVEAFCNGIFFAGEIGLDWSQPEAGVFDVDIKANEMVGKMSQMQQLCTHFNKPFFFLKIPLDGNLSFRGSGGHLHFAFHGGEYDLKANIDGNLADGCLLCPNADMELQEIGLNFAYDHTGNKLDFSDIQGTLMVGKPNHVEEYALVAERVHFTDYANNEAEFDVWVGDKKRDIVRLTGKTRTVLCGRDGEAMLNVMLDHSLSHFGDVYPSVFKLTIKNWSQIESFKLELDLQMKTLLADLQRFSRTGLMFLSRGLLKELNTLKTAEGGFSLNLSYDGERSLFTYELSGMDIAVGKHKFHKFLLNGNRKDCTWSVEQLQLDEISLAADLLKNDREWKVNFLGARFGDALLAGLEGRYLEEDGKLEAKINLLEADLSRLQGWPALKSFVEEIQLAGQLRATGLLTADFNPELPSGMSVEIDLEGSLRGGTLQGLHFQDIENASLHYKTDSGFALNNIKTSLKGSQDGLAQAGIFLKKIDCNFAHKELTVDKLFFRVPSDNLAWLADNLQRSFPGALKEPVAEIIRSLKYKDGLQGEVQGALTLEISEPHCALRLSLNDGVYEFMNQEHDVRGFVLEYDPFELKISSIYRLQQEWLSATLRSTVPSLDSGDIVLLDNPHLDPALQEHLRGGIKPLTIHWQLDPQHGFYIKKLEGMLRGIHVDVLREPSLQLDSDCMHLTGRVQLDMSKAHVLFDPAIAENLRNWEVGNGYFLQGLWTLDKNSGAPFSKSISFNGELQGREFELYGYRFYNLSAQVAYERGLANIKNILLSDSCGNIKIADMFLEPLANDVWSMKVPFVAVNNFRPGLLRSLDMSPSSVGRFLNIRQMEIQEITGVLGDKNSFKGNGRLAFVNPPRKNLQHTIFAIPAEILTRIGLDLAVLTPVRGAIYYEINNGRVLFTRFKDIYSKGKLSKFYLPNNGYQSSVDFDGNLDLQVRMKQYNLVFKLAELFTVTVQGTLSKPTYSLSKQQKKTEN